MMMGDFTDSHTQKYTRMHVYNNMCSECSNDKCLPPPFASRLWDSHTKAECGSDAMKDILPPASLCLLVDGRISEAIFIRNTRLHERHGRVALLSLSECDCYGRVDVIHPIGEAPVLNDLHARHDLLIFPDDISTEERECAANFPADACVALCECL